MNATILSLNIGVPETIEWEGKRIETSMRKRPTDILRVGLTSISSDSFANTKHHGTPDAVLYAYGADALEDYFSRLVGAGATSRSPNESVKGDLGENITLDVLNEALVSVGDTFRIGSVVAQATFPRIPCAKINFRMKQPNAMKTMIQAGRSGIYFRILEPGEIRLNDSFELLSPAHVRFTISEVYDRMVGGVKVSRDDVSRAHANGAFPKERLALFTGRAGVDL